MDEPLLRQLAAEAGRKSAVCWLSYRHPGGAVRERLVWHAWYDDAVVVLAGDTGQPLEGLDRAAEAEVTMRSRDTRARLVTWPARVQVVDPSAAEWDAHAAALVAVRLNLTDPEAAVAAWRTSCRVVRLNPPPTGG